MNRNLTLLGAAALMTLTFSGAANAVPALGDPYQIQQSDGTVFTAIDRGDEWQNWIENDAGFTVAPDAAGIWRYARAFDASRNPVLTDTPATGNPPPGLAKHLSRPSRRPPAAPGRSAGDAGGAATAAHGAAAAGSGNRVLFILTAFTDRSGSTSEASWASFVSGNIGDYFSKTSHGNAVVLGANDSDGSPGNGVVGWLNVGYNHPNTGSDIDVRNRQLAKDAILAADPYVDYASYDSNGDGWVDGNELGVVVIVAGYERAYSGLYAPSVWGHKWNPYAGSDYPLVDGVRVYEYAQFGEFHETHQATMGIMVHELGHLLYGLPDLYDTDGSSSGIGGFGVMGSGSWGQASTDSWPGQTPVNASAWTKDRLQWVNTTAGYGAVSIMASGDPASPDYRVYRGSSGTPDQYFLVENRQPTGYDAGLWRQLGAGFGGLAIWHVDDTRTSNSNDSQRWVDLEEADGGQMGTGRGYAAALWSSPHATTFDDGTTPNSRLYDGSNSGVTIGGISGSATAMTANFDGVIADPPNADFSCATSDLSVDCTDTSSDSDGTIASWFWNFGDDNNSTLQNPSHTYEAAGTYTVTLTVTDNDGATDSASQSVTVAAAPGLTVHIGDLDGSISPASRGRWIALVSVTVHDAREDAVSDALVEGSFSGDASGSASCTTDNNGQCVLTNNNLKGNVASVALTVDNVSGAGTYSPAANHDADGDSNGTTIVVSQSGGTGNQSPTAAFSATASGLTANFTDASTDIDGSVVSWSWDFGDDTASTIQNPSHTYAAAGTYSVTLIATDNGDASDTVTQNVSVGAPGDGITLAATGYKVKGLQKADLAWSGANGSSVDVYRNGAKVWPGTPNDGEETDNIDQKGGGSYTYQICEPTAPTTCSNAVTVSF